MRPLLDATVVKREWDSAPRLDLMNMLDQGIKHRQFLSKLATLFGQFANAGNGEFHEVKHGIAHEV
jgi:hypothetical protein